MHGLGNQIEQFLGMLAFSKQINRTLILPPWNIMDEFGAKFIHFDRLFRPSTLNTYHRCLLMEEFMKTLAPQIWPLGKRAVLCYAPRYGSQQNDCNAKEGSPFGPFWSKFGISFDSSLFYSPLTVDSPYSDWEKLFPLRQFPVLAFVSAPSPFPAHLNNQRLHYFIDWSEEMDKRTDLFIREFFVLPFVAIHLRNGEDFGIACNLLKDGVRRLFSSAQCHGEQFQYPPYQLTSEMCSPSLQNILSLLRYAIKLIGARSLFVATDNKPPMAEIQSHLRETDVKKIIWMPDRQPQEDLAMLGRANLAILNCVSSFSAAAKRERDHRQLPTMFWGLRIEEQRALQLPLSSNRNSSVCLNEPLKFDRACSILV
ncbi:unnamed protein product [Calicophoron daubneyi]|uniref:GDP-fucose protein O-fucosyltransferase 1 n=1 Tax=Calicophoron daubneyi TaxID=300641 RepID=A0AAV2TIV2_CALDB